MNGTYRRHLEFTCSYILHQVPGMYDTASAARSSCEIHTKYIAARWCSDNNKELLPKQRIVCNMEDRPYIYDR